MKNLLNVKNINISYRDLQVIWDVSFHIDKGEIVSIVGSNGAGKTTTLRAISGIRDSNLKILNGEITYVDTRIDKLPPYKIVEMGIVQIPEGRLIFPRMSVINNLILGAYVKKARDNVDDSLEEVFKLFPKLKERKNQMAGTLSGGERQMVAIGRGLMSLPKLIMFDEPSNLIW